MAQFGDDLDYEFGHNDFTWTATSPCTVVMAIRIIPFVLMRSFRKWLWISLYKRRLSFVTRYHRYLARTRRTRTRAARVFTVARIACAKCSYNLISTCVDKKKWKIPEEFWKCVLFIEVLRIKITIKPHFVQSNVYWNDWSHVHLHVSSIHPAISWLAYTRRQSWHCFHERDKQCRFVIRLHHLSLKWSSGVFQTLQNDNQVRLY